MPSARLCVQCKGRGFCGLKRCPILEKFQSTQEVEELIKSSEFSGPSPSAVFVGRENYPKVFTAPLSTPLQEEDIPLLDDPSRWYGLPQDRIVRFRSILIRSNKAVSVDSAANPDVFLMDLQDVAMSKNPVTMDINLANKPKYSLSFSPETAPQGPSAKMKFMELAENPHITTSVDKVHSDTDLKSKEAMLYLYRKGADIHKISNILSIGALGVGANRRLVPTRWAITAADTQISQEFIDNVRAYNVISDFRVFHSRYLDNDFYILLLPMTWSFEQIEVWNPGSVWQPGSEPVVAVDSELARNRKGYASDVTGAYYAARLGVAEYLDIEKIQAGAIVFREIGKKYMVPLGVWQIRENVRHAMKQKPMIFETLETAMKYLETKSRVKMELYNKHSKLLPFYRKQRRLFEYF